MDSIIKKSKALTVTGLKSRELKVIEDLKSDAVAVYRKDGTLGDIRINELIDVLRNDSSVRKALNLVYAREVYQHLVDTKILDSEAKQRNIEDILNKQARVGNLSSINTTLEHSEEPGRKLSHRLFRLNDSVRFMIAYLNKNSKKPVVAPVVKTEKAAPVAVVSGVKLSDEMILKAFADQNKVILEQTNAILALTEKLDQALAKNAQPAISPFVVPTANPDTSRPLVEVDEGFKSKLYVVFDKADHLNLTNAQKKTLETAKHHFDNDSDSTTQAAFRIVTEFYPKVKTQ